MDSMELMEYITKRIRDITADMKHLKGLDINDSNAVLNAVRLAECKGALNELERLSQEINIT